MASNRANGNEEFVEVERSTEVDAAAKEEQADSAAKGEEAESKSPIHKLAEQLTIEAERLAEGLTEEAKREAEKEASRIIADAELKAREQILEPALTEAAAKSRAIIAKAEQQAQQISVAVRELMDRVIDKINSEAADLNDLLPDSEKTSKGPATNHQPSRPPPRLSEQRELLKEVLAKRLAAP